MPGMFKQTEASKHAGGTVEDTSRGMFAAPRLLLFRLRLRIGLKMLELSLPVLLPFNILITMALSGSEFQAAAPT